jgi:TolB-like protein
MKTTVFVILLLALTGCVIQESVYNKDGKEYGVTSGLFRDRWWNYYERGLSFSDGVFYGEAIKDFQTAIERRGQDKWRSRTYGMHFVNYFPHRELGIIHYKTQQYNDAKQELENSLNTAESAKAKYFLNKTRKAILEKTGEDKLSPTLKINYPLDGTITNKFSDTIEGEAVDDYFVSSLEVDLIPLPLELSARKVSFKKELPLTRGMNEISIKASDLTGKTIEKILKIDVDREGPIVIIDDLEIIKEQKTAGRKVIVSGSLSDRTGIASFSINDRKIPVAQKLAEARNYTPDSSSYEMEFRQTIDISDEIDSVVLKAEDAAENSTIGKIKVLVDDYDSKDSMPDSQYGDLPILASSDPVSTGIIMEQHAFVGDRLRKLIDDIPPVIFLKDLTDFQTLYSNSLYLDGSASDNGKIKSLLINGESIIKRKAKEVFFNYLTELKEGVNKFFIEAVDTFGNREQKIVTVNRKIPEVQQIGSRMSVSILPLGHKGEQTLMEGVMHDSLISSFVNQRRFRVVERQKMEDVLKELKLSQTKLVDPDTAAKVGRIVVADAILTGTIYEKKKSIEVLTRLIDTETSSVIDAKDVFDEDKDMHSIRRLMEGLASKYKQSLPLLEGIVIKKDGKTVLIDAGTDKLIKKDMSIILFRESEEVKHPLTGRVLGSEPVELGEAKVDNVYKEFSRAVIKRGKPANIKVKDRMITK